DRWWDALGRVVARTGLTPNAITWIGFALSGANALAFVAHRHLIAFGLLVAVVEAIDNVDGAVARVTGQSTRAGAYLDATTDRYKDVFILLALGQVTGYWLAVAVAISGSLITSYAAARAAMLGAGADDKRGLPDLFERLERIATLCIGLVATPFFPDILGHDLLFWVLWFVAVMTQITAVQRFARRLRTLHAMDRTAP
ncbi:MAG TPA: CDP-alcohol phosphatidyltransferase family protein, partial [Alphaproteobacteria bacterium]|nr:CDP-alcohol phosphatidyltransferase family protein [Alphaproteobacteria bacterium]